MATFSVGSSIVTFSDTVLNSKREAGQLTRLTCGLYAYSDSTWRALARLLTPTYEIQEAINGQLTVDVRGGPGPGSLTISGYGVGAWSKALLVGLTQDTNIDGEVWQGVADFLVEEVAP